MEELKDFSRISPVVQKHLKRVYLSLFCILCASAFGAYVHVLWDIGGMVTTLGWVQKRFSLLFLFGLLQGASIGPCIEMAIDVNPSILINAFLGTAVVFLCFSAAAMLARRREYLYLGGMLSSGLSLLTWLRTSEFASSSVEFQLYFGLVIFVGYIVFDTQKIIEKAHYGDMDYVHHSMIFFIDFIGVFVHALIIMLKKSEGKEEKRRKRRNRCFHGS